MIKKMRTKLPREFYIRDDTLAIARELLGKLLVVPDNAGRRVTGMIVETEAYCGIADRAAHSYGGRRTARNEITYGIGGHAYVFLVYGLYYQLNIVTNIIEEPDAVLIRAIEPIDGRETIRTRRGTMNDRNLTSGPGKLCIALGIDKSFNSEDMLGDKIWLEEHRSFSSDEISVGKRIGIDYAGEDAVEPWRFWVTGNPFVSRLPRGS